MKLRSQQDIAAPCEDVFAALTDFAGIERRILRRGVQIRRLDQPPADTAGAEWEARFRLRGRERKLLLLLTECNAPTTLALDGMSPGFSLSSTVELIALSHQSTRMAITFTTVARTMPARAVLRALRLTRGRTQRRFDQAITRLVQEVTG